MAIKHKKPKLNPLAVVGDIRNESIERQIGQMCVAWAALEYVLFRLFWFLTALPTPVARSMFYSQNTNHARIALLHATYTPLLTKKNYKPLAAGKKIKVALDGLGKLATARNSYIHDPWASNPENAKITAQLILKTKGSHGELQLVKAKDIAALKRKIYTAGDRLVKLTDKLVPQFAASRKRLLLDRDLTLVLSKKPHQKRKTKHPSHQPRSFRP